MALSFVAIIGIAAVTCIWTFVHTGAEKTTTCYEYKGSVYQKLPNNETDTVFVLWTLLTTFEQTGVARCISHCHDNATCKAVAINDGKCNLLSAEYFGSGTTFWENDGTWLIYTRKGATLDMPIFRLSSGTDVDVWNDWHNGYVYVLDYLFFLLDMATPLDVGYYYRHAVIDNWQLWDISEVILTLYQVAQPVVQLNLNASGTTSSSWFSLDRLISSPWDDLINTGNQTSEMAFTNQTNRSFYIMDGGGDCASTAGWMMALRQQSYCSWTFYNEFPVFMYTPEATKRTFESGPMSKADDLMVSVRLIL